MKIFSRLLAGSQNLVSHQVHSNLIRFGAIEVEGVHRFQDIASELFPRVTLREDGLGEAFRTVPAVGFLGDLKYQLVHNTTLPYQVMRRATHNIAPKQAGLWSGGMGSGCCGSGWSGGFG